MPRVAERLHLLRLLWPIGAAFLLGLSLYFAIVGAGVYALLHLAGWVFGFDATPWFLLTTLAWVPVVSGYALTASSSDRVVVYVSEPRLPEGTSRMPAGGSGLGTCMSETGSKRVSSAALMMVMGGILAANLAPIVLIIEFIEWLTSREWPGLTLADGLALFGIVRDLPESESQRLIDLVLAIPLSISLFAVGLLLCTAGLNLGDRSVSGNASRFSRKN